MSKEKQTSGGVGFVGLLTLLFITLKLCKIITWSWLWVLCPLWITPAIVIGVLIIGLVIAVVLSILE